MWVVYGLKNCDTCRKALRALEQKEIAHEFIDYRQHPIAIEQLLHWKTLLGTWSPLLNKASTTWRGLDTSQQSPSTDDDYLALFNAFPTLLKRPILIRPGGLPLLGYKEQTWFASEDA